MIVMEGDAMALPSLPRMKDQTEETEEGEDVTQRGTECSMCGKLAACAARFMLDEYFANLATGFAIRFLEKEDDCLVRIDLAERNAQGHVRWYSNCLDDWGFVVLVDDDGVVEAMRAYRGRARYGVALEDDRSLLLRELVHKRRSGGYFTFWKPPEGLDSLEACGHCEDVKDELEKVVGDYAALMDLSRSRNAVWRVASRDLE